MENTFEANVQLAGSLALILRLQGGLQRRHEAPQPAAVAEWRDLRSLRAITMVELAVAWSDPVWRQRWRAAGR